MHDFENENNLEALLWENESEKEMPYHNSFLETNEKMLLDDSVYREMHFKEYNYVVGVRDNNF